MLKPWAWKSARCLVEWLAVSVNLMITLGDWPVDTAPLMAYALVESYFEVESDRPASCIL